MRREYLFLQPAFARGSFFFYKILVAALPPLTVVSGRVLIAALLLNIIILARGGRSPADPRLWAAFLAMGEPVC